MTKQSTDYRALSRELDELLSVLQAGELGVDEAIEAYERGQKIIAELQTYLKTAETRITKVKA